MKRLFLALALVAPWLFSACRSTQSSETAEMRRELRAEMKEQREQLKASGATAEQLREFDRSMEQMEQAMREMEKQMRALERQLGKQSN